MNVNKAYEVIVNYDILFKSLASGAIEFVNLRKEAHGHPSLKRIIVFENYFKALFDALIEIRDASLNSGKHVLASIIADVINRPETNLTQTIADVLGENSLLEEKIEEV